MNTDASAPTGTLLLIDGHSLAFRAFYALPAENFATSTGQHTNAVYGFMSMLLNVLAAEEPSHLAVSFDLTKPRHRLEQYPEYKAGRKPTPPEFAGQIDLLIELLSVLKVSIVTSDGHEADDVIATLAARAEDQGMDSLVISGDRDCLQLVTERTTLLYPKRGVSDLARMTPEAVEERYAVTPENYPGLAALVGEKADNLPGVPGVGDKTAAKWLSAHGDLDGVIAHADEIGGRAGENLRAHLDGVIRNRSLNRLRRDLVLDTTVEETRRGEPEAGAVAELLDVLEFRALSDRMDRVFGLSATAVAPETPAVEVELVDSAGLIDWLDARDDDEVLAVASDAAYSLGRGDVTRIALAAQDTGVAAIALDLGELSAEGEERLHTLLTAPGRLVFEDAKVALKALSERGLVDVAALDPVSAPHDVALAAYVLRPELRGYGLEELSTRYLGRGLSAVESGDDQLALELDGGVGALRELAARARAIADVHPVIREALGAAGGTSVLDDMERPSLVILARAELAGIAVDTELLSQLASDFHARAEASAEEAFAVIGDRINLGSPKQLQTVLFEKLNMRKTKRTKTGYTTDAESLAELYAETGNPFLEHVLAYRDATKLAQIVEGLGRSVADDGRIHTTYLQTVAATGRLSSVDPNLQNIPVRSEAGRRIRELFIAGRASEGLLTADYSQIEMRIMAHLSEDAGLIEAYAEGEDLHSFVGARVFGVAPEEVTADMRSKVKAMSYGLVYGLSAYGLSRQLSLDVDEARALMTGYFERFGGVRTYLDEVVDEARQAGYTETIFGRRRPLPDLRSDQRQRREMAERAALNAPIQGSAADIMKRAMIGVDRAMTDAGLSSRMLLQVHDELVLEVAPGEREELERIVREEMGAAADLAVPLEVNIGAGPSWHAAAH